MGREMEREGEEGKRYCKQLCVTLFTARLTSKLTFWPFLGCSRANHEEVERWNCCRVFCLGWGRWEGQVGGAGGKVKTVDTDKHILDIHMFSRFTHTCSTTGKPHRRVPGTSLNRFEWSWLHAREE